MEDIAQKLNQNQLQYIAKNIYPDLDSAVTELIDHLLVIGEDKKYAKYKRNKYFSELYIKQENLRNKGEEELGSDYNEDSDDEFRKAEQLVDTFENNFQQNPDEFEEIREGKYVQGRLKDLKEQRKKERDPVQYAKEQEEAKQNEISDSELSDSSEEVQENQEDKEEEERQKQELPLFNPLEYLANKLREVKLIRIAREKEEEKRRLELEKQRQEELERQKREYEEEQLRIQQELERQQQLQEQEGGQEGSKIIYTNESQQQSDTKINKIPTYQKSLLNNHSGPSISQHYSSIQQNGSKEKLIKISEIV